MTKDGKPNKHLIATVKNAKANAGKAVKSDVAPAIVLSPTEPVRRNYNKRKMLTSNDLIKRLLTDKITADDRIEIATLLIRHNVGD